MTLRPGFPIRKSADQRLLAPPHGLSQRATSFIASQCQGIHQMPLLRLIQSDRSLQNKPPRHSQHFSNLIPATGLRETAPRTLGRIQASPARAHGKTPAAGNCIRSTMSNNTESKDRSLLSELSASSLNQRSRKLGGPGKI